MKQIEIRCFSDPDPSTYIECPDQLKLESDFDSTLNRVYDIKRLDSTKAYYQNKDTLITIYFVNNKWGLYYPLFNSFSGIKILNFYSPILSCPVSGNWYSVGENNEKVWRNMRTFDANKPMNESQIKTTLSTGINASVENVVYELKT